ncbi:hypothetical protein [Methylobacterium sp. J-077]|uniref:hypothetical protein n=1 Tax=Methylobacterium sp. J-077 TaxID=2836656 RepID=UPI001FBB0E58|nr:hypothetical protein [Methylobacterium sp. J-077]MCJ2126081.1 hypothetical protein [Methylobacterium sp. J-077]
MAGHRFASHAADRQQAPGRVRAGAGAPKVPFMRPATHASANQTTRHADSEAIQPKTVFSDRIPDALALCLKNPDLQELNMRSKSWTIQHLDRLTDLE